MMKTMKLILTFSLTIMTIFQPSSAVNYQMRVDVNSNVISKMLNKDRVHFNLCPASGACSKTYSIHTRMFHNKAYWFNFTSTMAAASIKKVNWWMEKTATLVCFDRVWISNVGTVEMGVLDGCMDQDTFTNTSCSLVQLNFSSTPASYTPMTIMDPCNYTTTNATVLASLKTTSLMTPTPAPYPVPPPINATNGVLVGVTVDSNVKATNGVAPVYFQVCSNGTYCTETYKVIDQWVRGRSYVYQVFPSKSNAFPTLKDVWTVNLWITAANTQVCVDKVWAKVGTENQTQLVAITGCMGNSFTLGHMNTAVPANGCSFLTVDISNTKVYTGHQTFNKWFTTPETTKCPKITGAVSLTVNKTTPTVAPTGAPTTSGGFVVGGVLSLWLVVGMLAL